MAIAVTCPNGHLLHRKDEFAGQSGFCSHSQAAVQVPNPKRVSEDEILTIVGPAFRPAPAEESVHHKTRRPETSRELVCWDRPRCEPGRFVCTVKSCSRRHSVFASHCNTPLSSRVVSCLRKAKVPTMSTYRYLDVLKYEDVIVVCFKGHHLLVSECVVTTVGDELDDVTDQPECHQLIVDFHGVEDVSSVLLGILVMTRKKMAVKRGHLILCGLGPEVREFFDETMLSELLDIRESEADAFAALASDVLSA